MATSKQKKHSADNLVKAPSKSQNKAARRGAKSGWKLVLGLFLALFWVGAMTIVAQLAVGYLMLWILGADTLSEPVPTAVFSALSYVLAMVAIIWLPPRMSVKWSVKGGKKKRAHKGEATPRATGRKELGLLGLPTWTDIGLAPVGFVVYLLLAAAITFLFTLFPWFDSGEAQNVGFDIYISGIDKLVAFLTLVVVAPIAEEIIFRGWLYHKLRQRLSHETTERVAIIVAAILVSLLFGLVHMQWNVGVNVFAMSLVLCALRELTGTIYAGILLHMIKNGFAFFLLYMVGF